MKTIIDDVECTDETSDGSTGETGTSVQAAVQAARAGGANQKCLCTVNRNKTSEQTIMIGQWRTFLANIFDWHYFVDRNLSSKIVTNDCQQKTLSPLTGLGSMDEPCSKLEDVIRSKIHSVERLPRKLGYKTYRK